MEWRKSAHGLLSEQHHVFKFAVKSYVALVRLAHLHVNICDYHFGSSDSLYRDYVWIKVLDKCQSLATPVMHQI